MLFPDKTLAIQLEKRLAHDILEYAESVKQLFPDYQPAHEAIGGGVAIYTGLPYINSAIALGLDAPVTVSDMEKLEALFLSHSINPLVELCPFVDPDFLNLLNTRNYQLDKFYTAYVHPLKTLTPTSNPAIVVKPIDRADSKVWVHTVMDIQPDDTQTNTHLAQAAIHRQHVVGFVAWIAGQPAGASAISIQDDLAILHFTATRHAYRNRGVQSAMIQARLAYAADQGCKLAFSTSVPGNNSMRNILRAGFQVAYTRHIMQKST